MKKYTFLLITLFILSSFSLYKPAGNQATKLKRYDVQSAIVHYKTTISGGAFGSTVNGSGTEHLYFKDWGNTELRESEMEQTTHSKLFGREKNETVHTHTMSKFDNGDAYYVDFDKKVIYKNRDQAMEMTRTYAAGDANKTGKQILEEMGGHIVGSEKILGYPCEIWEVMGGKQWIYKGLPLKISISMMGITTVTVATEARFDIPVDDTYFTLPDFKIKK